ncbi:hypothetical protein IVG45_10665 [Methylomonas sp. LL1]|uniref:hypothetical protein n=1 Tax=Methylomonas sp. LL1 TaxID=2785785 RepID=UPI0018C43E78|nr:hypothetical protein [Methylomonas sp. LL1]QPK65352.1 hypothetical protein IVG45_10665 [Methylomonas sp. LL1]
MSKILSLLKANMGIVILFTIATLLCSQRLTAYIIIPIAIPALLYQSIQILRYWHSPQQRAIRLTAIVIIITSLSSVLVFHIYRHYSVRTKSEQIAKTIEMFYLNNNRYPDKLEEMGIDPKEVLDCCGLYFHVYNDSPALTYDVTYIPMDWWNYSFTTHEWIYIAP